MTEKKNAMDKGREMHDAVLKNWATRAKPNSRTIHIAAPTEACPALPNDPNVVYIDAEAADGKIRALLDAHSDKPTIIVISDDHSKGMDPELKALIEGRHPMQKAIKTMTLGDIIKMPPKAFFVQEHMNDPSDGCHCEFDPYDDGDTEPSTHYKRLCAFCGRTWFGLHCPHDGHQRPCPNCGKKPTPVK